MRQRSVSYFRWFNNNEWLALATKLLEEYLTASKIGGAAIILATHNLTMGFGVADRLAILR